MSLGLGIPKDVLDAAEALRKARRSFNWTVPETVERKGTWARWSELVNVEEAYREDARTGRAGQTGRTNMVLKIKVLPGDSPNAGRTFMLYLLFNFPFANGDASGLAEGRPAGEETMNAMTLDKLNQMATILGFDITDGEHLDAMFPEAGGQSAMVGQQWAVDISDNNDPKEQYNNENAQNVDGFHPAEV